MEVLELAKKVNEKIDGYVSLEYHGFDDSYSLRIYENKDSDEPVLNLILAKEEKIIDCLKKYIYQQSKKEMKKLYKKLWSKFVKDNPVADKWCEDSPIMFEMGVWYAINELTQQQ